MASFLSGPAAHLVGAGMQAIGVGIPVGETSAKVIEGLRNVGVPVPPKTWFKRKGGDKEHSEQHSQQQQQQQRQARDERNCTKTVYDKLEAHVNGMIQVVKPVIELKKLVRDNCCKSAERPRREASRSPTDKLKYYTPQKCFSNAACNLFGDQKSPSPKRGATRKCEKRRRCAKRPDSSPDEEDQHCMYCSRTRSLLKLPCGSLICTKCDQTADHQLECKLCKEAETSHTYAY